MNPNPKNYGSPEACQRLVAAGIVVETDAIWRIWKDYPPQLIYKSEALLIKDITDMKYIPALSMAEVLREFTSKYSAQEFAELIRDFYQPRNEKGVIFYMYLTLTDIEKAIDLLVWARKTVPDRRKEI